MVEVVEVVIGVVEVVEAKVVVVVVVGCSMASVGSASLTTPGESLTEPCFKQFEQVKSNSLLAT